MNCGPLTDPCLVVTVATTGAAALAPGVSAVVIVGVDRTLRCGVRHGIACCALVNAEPVIPTAALLAKESG